MRKIYCILLLFLLASCTVFKPVIQPKREFRGVWIATVVNIDWPHSGADTWARQQADYLRILDFYRRLNLNAVIVQIRTAGDAFYPSAYAPWSRFLTGKEGVPPKTEEDPLQWMIRQAHIRGFEFHAWLNPYRATFDENVEILAKTHDFHTHPDWMFKYGKKYYYDPGIPEVQDHLVNIMKEVVRNYQVDALHFDDYFYPYRIQGEVIPDSLTYAARAMPGQALDDWRRSNIDSLVKKVHGMIQKEKEWVQFGISPFGVWKNNTTDPRGSDTQAGQTTYEDLYADPLKWMKEGYIDYLVPQVYWSMDLPVASHSKIVSWWAGITPLTNLYIGNAAYKVRDNADKAWERKKELPKQLRLARTYENIQGNVFFSARSLLNKNMDVVRHIKNKYYKYPALTPESPLRTGKSTLSPSPPILTKASNYYQFQFHFNTGSDYRYAMVYAARSPGKLSGLPPSRAIARIFLDGRNSFNLGKDLIRKRSHISITFLNRFGTESDPIVLNLE